MKFKDFMDYYDNWNGITKVNDDNLDMIIRHKTSHIMETCTDLFNMEVKSFGFYDGEFVVRLDTEGYDELNIRYESIENVSPINGVDLDYNEMIAIIHGCKSSIAIDKLTLERYNLSPEARISIENTIRTNDKIIDKICEYTISTLKQGEQ